MTTDATYDVLIIGSGAAGLSLALRIADTAKVGMVSKGTIDAGSTSWAQGGSSSDVANRQF